MHENKFAKFKKQKGFYISLITGVIAVFAICMISGTMLGTQTETENAPDTGKISASVADGSENNSQLAQAENTTPKSNAKDNKEIPEDKATNHEESNSKTEEPNTSGLKKDADTAPDAADSADTEPETASVSSTQNGNNLVFDEEKGLLWPLEGDVLMKFSMDQAVYFKTLAQYKCNPAMLIAGDEGVPVYASADCIISDIETSEETGITVTASIGGDYELVYGNLKEGTLEIGDHLEEGQVVGYLDTPTKYYVEEGTNLFFEVLENGKAQDPMLLLR